MHSRIKIVDRELVVTFDFLYIIIFNQLEHRSFWVKNKSKISKNIFSLSLESKKNIPTYYLKAAGMGPLEADKPTSRQVGK